MIFNKEEIIFRLRGMGYEVYDDLEHGLLHVMLRTEQGHIINHIIPYSGMDWNFIVDEVVRNINEYIVKKL